MLDTVTGLNLLRRLAHHAYDGGVRGTCLGCHFASPPLDRRGMVAGDDELGSDRTEAYFKCSLPGRDGKAIEWGEYAPCTDAEWFKGVVWSMDLDGKCAKCGGTGCGERVL